MERFYCLPGPPTRGREWEVHKHEQFLQQKPQTANQIATTRHENSKLVLENHDAWIVEEPQVEETHLDPYQNAFFAGDEVQNPIDNAFRASLKCQRVLLDYYKLPEDKCAAIAEAIANGKAKAISDGSFRPIEKKGTSGFIITPGKTTENSYQGCNWVPGLENEQSAYRSELAGISGLLASLKIIVKKFKITSGSIEIGLDGESAKDQAEDDYFLKIQQSSFDIILDIRRRVKELPINIKWRWIKGHAREKGFRLNWWHLMNEKMDTLAKKFMKKQIDNNKERYTVRLWYEKWAFYVNGNKLANVNKNAIYEYLYGVETLEYWQYHHDVPMNHPSHAVDWEPARLALNRLSMGIRRIFWKFSSGHIGNQHMLWHRNEIETPRCLLCDHHEERSSHVLQCKNVKTRLQFVNLVKTKLEPILKEQKTEPNLRKAIIKILCKGRRGDNIDPNDYSEDHGLRDAIREQEENLKWYHFMMGRWSPKWRKVQEQYLTSIKSKRSSLRWCTAIIYKLMLIVWDIWQYRNQLVFADDGELQVEERNRINILIYQEFVIGREHLLEEDQFLFEDFDLDSLLRSDTKTKKTWIARINAARHAIDLPEEAEQTVDEAGMTQLTFDHFGWTDT